MNKDPNYVVRVEKAIAEKYGKEAVQNPRVNWTPEKEEEYKQQLKDFLQRTRKDSAASEKVEINGVLISKKLLSRDTNRSCPDCSEYSFSSLDDVYMNMFCNAYIQTYMHMYERKFVDICKCVITYTHMCKCT